MKGYPLALSRSGKLCIGDTGCIIQDDEGDWLKESMLMGEIYRNGACNIAASAAAAGISKGLFADRDPNVLSAAYITWVRKEFGEASFCYTDAIMPPRDSMALSQRGWVMQERLLSPRTIYFDEQIVWECHEMVACEAFPRSIGRLVKRETHEKWGEGGTPFKIGSMQSNPRSTFAFYHSYTEWLYIVEVYSKNNLTYESDIFPAISGVARHFHRSLLWYIDANSMAYPQDYRASSWSWAAVKAPIKFLMRDCYEKPFEDFTDEIEVIKAQTKLLSADPYGKISDSPLVVSGGLREARKRRRVDHTKADSSGNVFFDLFDDQKHEEGHQDTTIFYFLVITTEFWKLMGLILEATDQEPGQYRRIGVFMHAWGPTGDEMLPDFPEFAEHCPGQALEKQTITII